METGNSYIPPFCWRNECHFRRHNTYSWPNN
ncbi:hypothetical protein Ahy_A07g034597 isoform B [Arachis hypogaea]|uniref:Uncharacterized protein n=1 Tax=Arachis hypogaea TaxID=3818 RepID=A0A445CCL9_ARAHY|nr:hypothetical protein Ahy_A07g034597 isoform B [Arachis hypogaea]